MTSKTILLVEDNRDYQELIKLAFEESNIAHYLVTVNDGVEALDYILRPENRRQRMPNLVLLDLNLPKVNGLQVLHRLRSERQTRFLPIVMMSASNEPLDLINSYSLGCNSYVRKPIDFTQLQYLVQQLAIYWLTLNEVPPMLGAGMII